MATLASGVRYGLSSERSVSESKNLVFVKLTDSAFRAIEEYMKMKAETSERPTIEFVGGEGRIKFPSRSPNRGNFNFTISSNLGNEGPQGGFDCVRHTARDQLESLATMLCRMQIKANDDVYETTRSRMQQVEVDNKNKCTRVLKANDSVNKKVRIKRHEPRKFAPASTSSALKHEPRVSDLAKQTKVSVSSKVEVKKDEVVKAPSVSYSKAVKKDDKVTKESRTSSCKSSGKADVKSNEKNNASRNSNGVKYKSLLERITQLLAVRAYTKFELKTRFTREGVLEKEKNQLTSNLQTVAYLKDNKYHLKKHCYTSVQEDWPFYTEEEKLQVRVNKVTNLVGDSSDSSCSGLTPRSTCSASPSSNAATSPVPWGSKRKIDEQEIVGHPTKKQRISNHHKSDSKSSSEVKTKSHTSSGNGHEKSKKDGRKQQPVSESSPKQDISNSRGSTPESATAESSAANTESSRDLNQLSLEDSDGADEALFLPMNKEFVLRYATITTYEQRSQYKNEYHTYWPAYQKLHNQRSNNAKKFSELQDKFRQVKSTGDTVGVARIKKKIYEEFNTAKDMTVKYNNLHKKLKHIKQMIQDFDDRLCDEL